MHDHAPDDGKYLYGIISTTTPHSFATRGLGERGDAVYTLHYGDLAALVSDSPVVEYDSTRRNMMVHTRVLEEVMAAHTVLPVRFGIVAPNEVAIEHILSQREAELRAVLAQLDGKIELGLKAFWYEEVIFNEIVARHPAIRDLRDSLAGRTAEQSYYERIRLGELIEAAMTRQREEDAAHILSQLEPIVEQSLISPVITDRMVVNAAFLLERSREPEFDAVIQALDAEMGKRMMFKYVGPVPPYNFVTMTMSWG